MNQASFLQSAEWQEIQERMGRKTERPAGVLVIRHNLPLGFHYLYAPRPPTLTKDFLAEAERVALGSGSLFLKIDPTEPVLEIRNSKLEIRTGNSLQPQSTVLIDCQKNEEMLLKAMHEKARYNIRLAGRHGLRVEPVLPEDIPKKLDSFWRLLAETARREGFSPHPKEHYRILLETRSDSFSNQLWCAELEGQPLAWAVVNWFSPSGTATYLHGASSRLRREVMAPHLLHWELIKSARNRGFQTYDFGGIDEVRWPGLTRFKKSFGGKTHTYPPSCDFVFRPTLYQLYHLQHALRHIS